MKNNQSGKLAEIYAQAIFMAKGYRIVAKNYTTGKGTGAGEVDFVAIKKNLLVFVEVKQRKTLEDAAYSIMSGQQQRIWNGAEAFIQKNPEYQDFDIRFDAVLISLPFKYKHIEDAFRL